MASLELDNGAAKADFNITGVATFASYSGFVAQKQNINKASTIGFGTVGVGTFQLNTMKQRQDLLI